MDNITHAPPAQLLAAYRAARYRVQAPGRDLLLFVDRHDAELAKLLREAWVESAALLTAWNPGSRQQALAENQALQAELERELKAAGFPCLPGRNEPALDSTTTRHWHEDSILALDMSLEAARAAAQRFGQLAFLWIGRDAIPRLVVTAPAQT